MLGLCHIKSTESAIRSVILCSLAALAVLLYVQLPFQKCDGHESHLHANGKRYIHHHETNHHLADHSEENTTDALAATQIDSSVSPEFSKLKEIDCLGNSLFLETLFAVQHYKQIFAAEQKNVDHPPDKYFIRYCSFLI